LRNLQSKLFLKETSLQEMKTELENYKENNAPQSLQIMSLRDDVKDLHELTASLMKINILKNLNQSLERGNSDLIERVIELENCLRDYRVERGKAEQNADLLEKRLSCSCRVPPRMNLKGQEDSLDIFPVKDKGEADLATSFERDIFNSKQPDDGQKISNKCQQDLIHKETLTSESDRPPHFCSWETTPEQAHHQDFLGQLATLLSDRIGPIPATEEAVKERIQEMGANEQLWKSRTETLQQEIQVLTKRLEQLYHLYEEASQEPPRTEENDREQKIPLKHLEGNIAVSDFSPERLDMGKKRENSRTQASLTDKHNKKFKQLEMLLNIRQNSVMATTPRMEEKIQRLQKQLSDLKLSNKNMKTQLTRINVLKLADFRETIMKMLGFNMKTADKEVINKLKLVIRVYEISKRPKIASDCETGQDR
ncbi:uncharacterized protein LOC103747972, partial [Nannospalax galili]|uniref:uncharacterized protein LOC103747972 n=1 Tax=Nannospalax galili TaxID=1026970 RepID=UPI00111BD00C